MAFKKLFKKALKIAPAVVGIATGNPYLAAATAGGSSLARGKSIGSSLTSAALAGGATALSSGSFVQSLASQAPQTAGAIADVLNTSGIASAVSGLSTTQMIAGAAIAGGALSSAGTSGSAIRAPQNVTPPDRNATDGLLASLGDTPAGSTATFLTGALGLGVQEFSRGKRRLLGVTA